MGMAAGAGGRHTGNKQSRAACWLGLRGKLRGLRRLRRVVATMPRHQQKRGKGTMGGTLSMDEVATARAGCTHTGINQ